MWLMVHLTFLTGFKNRFAALFSWSGTFLVGSRAERTITLRQVIGRVAIDEAGGEELTRSIIAAPEPGDGEPS
jgi:NADH:ubiquinone reductase (H+-translocating)